MSHFYIKNDGVVSTRHEVEMATRPGEFRPTRITDFRKWKKAGDNVVPSVTTILNILDKPALITWKVNQHLEIAYNMRADEYHSYRNYEQDVKRLTELEMSKAPEMGTSIHEVLESYANTGQVHPADLPMCKAVEALLLEKTERNLQEQFLPEASFVSNIGFGGCVDLVSDYWVIDYKSKQKAKAFKPGKMVFDDHLMQLAAYRAGLDMPHARCGNLFVCVETGRLDFHEHKEADLVKAGKMFEHCLKLWQLKNGVE